MRSRRLTFQQIVDSRFKEDKNLLLKRVKEIKKNLSELPGVETEIGEPYKLIWDACDDPEPCVQWRVNFYVRKDNNNKKVVWNDIYAAVGKVKPVPYDFKKWGGE